MKVKFLGENSFLILTKNAVYDVMAIECFYRIFDELCDDYLYPFRLFEIVGKEEMEELLENDQF